MPRLSLLPTLLRESLGPRTLPREPEPDLVMDSADQVRAFAEAGRIDGVMSAAYLLHSARISEAIQGARLVVDLGCGPATQLGQVAALNPSVEFLGVDLSEGMLGNARQHVASVGLDNVRFERGDITALDFIADQSADAVISTMTLHHLPTVDHLQRCFREIRRILRPGGGLYLVDFGRLKSLKSVLFFAYMNEKHQPHLFSLDYERSLRAAFTLEDFSSLAAADLPDGVGVYPTFLVPMLVIMQTAPNPLGPGITGRLKEMRQALPRRYRADLDELRFFFRLGGLPSDPFR